MEAIKAIMHPVDTATQAANNAAQSFTESTLLNEIVINFQTICENSFTSLRGPALALCATLLIIEFATDWTLYDGEVRVSKFINTIIKGAAFFFLIMNWKAIIWGVEESAKRIGQVASGLPVGEDMAGPSDILNQGFKALQGIFGAVMVAVEKAIKNVNVSDAAGLWIKTKLKNMVLDGWGTADLAKAALEAVNPMGMLCYLITIFLILFSYTWIALQLFLCYIEYYIFMGLVTIFLPFGVCRYTKFLFDRTIQGMINFGVKMMGTIFLIGIVTNSLGLIDENLVIPAGQQFSFYLRVSLMYLCVAFLVWKLPDKFAGMMSGHGPSISAGEAIGGAMVAGSLATQGVGMVAGGVHTLSMATRSDIRDPSKASTYNPLKIAGNLAEITTARVGAAVTHPWAAGARNAEIDVSQWDSFVSGNYQNLKWDYPNH